MAVALQELVEKSQGLLRLQRGDPQFLILGVSSCEEPLSGHVVFAADSKNAKLAARHDVGLLVVSEKLFKVEGEGLQSVPRLATSTNPHLAMAKTIEKHFAPQSFSLGAHDQGIHPSALIHPSAHIGKNVSIGPFVVIGENCVIEDGVRIGPHTVIEAQVKVGRGCRIHSQVFIGFASSLGEECCIYPQTVVGGEGFGYTPDSQGRHHHKPHLGRVVLEARVDLGSGVYVDRGLFGDSLIGEGTKVDNYCHIGHNARIGKNCLITAGFISAGSVTIGDNCTFGGRCSVNGHIEICSGVTIAGVSSIPGSITQPGVYGGYPPESYMAHKRTLSTLPHIARMRRNLSKIMRKLNLDLDEK